VVASGGPPHRGGVTVPGSGRPYPSTPAATPVR